MDTELLLKVAVSAGKVMTVLLVLSGSVAYLVLLERKVIAFMQSRLGPRRVANAAWVSELLRFSADDSPF